MRREFIAACGLAVIAMLVDCE